MEDSDRHFYSTSTNTISKISNDVAVLPQHSHTEFNDTPESSFSEKERSKLVKRLNQLCISFASILQNEWIHLDDQLQDVISSIVNIRYRLPIEHRMYVKAAAKAGLNDGDYDNLNSFDKLYISQNLEQEETSSSNLHLDDVWLGLSHDAIQHEKMLGHVRTLTMQLNQAHEALGRQLDKAMQFQFDSSIQINEAIFTEFQTRTPILDERKGTVHFMLAKLQRMVSLYHSLSNELLRKQVIAKQVITHVEGLVPRDGDGTPSKHTKAGAMDLSQIWSREGKCSLVDAEEIKKILSDFGA